MASQDSFKPGDETLSEDEGGVARKGDDDDDEYVPDGDDVLEGDNEYIPDVPDDDDDDFELEEVKPKKKKKKTKKKTTTTKKTVSKKRKTKENDETESNKTTKKAKKTTPKKKKATTKKKKAPKKAKLSLKDATSKLKEYLIRENRPLNAIAVYENTQRIVPKSKLSGILEDLASRADGGVKMKKFGKQAMFYADQSQFENVTKEKIDELKQEVKDSKGRVQALKRKFGQLKAASIVLEAEPSDKELASVLPDLRKTVEDMDTKIEAFKAKGEVVDPSKKEKMIKKVMKYVQVWKKRKRQAMDVVDKMADGYEKKPKEIIKMIELETDDEYKADLNDFKQPLNFA